jgi:hypothetical protein
VDGIAGLAGLAVPLFFVDAVLVSWPATGSRSRLFRELMHRFGQPGSQV